MSCCTRCRPCARRLLGAPAGRRDRALTARSPTPSTRSSPPTSAWRSSSSASARSSARKARPGSACASACRSGAWGEMESSVNTLIDDLLWPTTEVTRTIAAVAQGDLLQTVRLDVDGRPLKGEFLRSATIVNTMIKQLGVFTSEVTRVAREVGTDGKLGGQAQVREVTGVWKDLTESVNSMASQPDRAGAQHRRRDHRRRQRRPVEEDHRRRARRDPAAQGSHQHDGRSAALVRRRGDARRARGRHRRQLGGQAVVPGVAGTWKDLTDNVNAAGRQPDRPRCATSPR